MSESWKSFCYGTIAAIAIAAIAGVIMNGTAKTAGEKYATSSTRL